MKENMLIDLSKQLLISKISEQLQISDYLNYLKIIMNVVVIYRHQFYRF